MEWSTFTTRMEYFKTFKEWSKSVIRSCQKRQVSVNKILVLFFLNKKYS
jgi:hypothetical protein